MENEGSITSFLDLPSDARGHVLAYLSIEDAFRYMLSNKLSLDDIFPASRRPKITLNVSGPEIGLFHQCIFSRNTHSDGTLP
jgi:hypothetical protein